MENNEHKFRLRLNLFDAIVLVAVLLVGAALAWFGLRSGGGESAPTSQPVQYTILFQSMTGGSSALIEPGDPLVDTVKNYNLGTVVSVRAEPAVVQVLNQETQTYVDAVLEGYEDVYVTVESTCTVGDDSLVLDGGYEFRVGQVTYIRGPGYMGSGPITEIVREAEG